MKSKLERAKGIFTAILTILFVVGVFGTANALESRCKPKGDKKIVIGVLDLMTKIEVSALWCDAYREAAKKRGWEIRIFDIDLDYSKCVPYMENMITAGYDAIIVNWTSPKYYPNQVMKAFKKGIPVVSVAAGQLVPGFVADFGPVDIARGALVAQYLSSKLLSLKEPGKVVNFTYKESANNYQKYLGQKMVLDHFKIPVIERAQRAGGDPSEQAYQEMKNLLLADTKKEIKGVLGYWEGVNIPAAKAAHEMGRDDIVVVAIDDSPMTYEMIRTLPTLHGTAGVNGYRDEVTDKMMKMLEAIFAGKPFTDLHQYPLVPYLVTKENLPPRGYLYNPVGSYEGRKPDYVVK